VRFVARREADAVVSEYWSGHPACLKHRLRHNLFLKFFDPLVFAPEEKFLILDADLFFYRKPEEILEWATVGTGSCFYNRDVKEVYALGREKIEAATGVRLSQNFNSGLVGVCKTAINPELSEMLLLNCEKEAPHPQFFEQSLNALNCSAYGRGGPLPPQYEITWNIFRRVDSVCRHYVGPAKWDHLFIEGPVTLVFSMTIPSVIKK
jgi:lipopolysaccharide biosynthesis glycosyltransferase